MWTLGGRSTFDLRGEEQEGCPGKDRAVLRMDEARSEACQGWAEGRMCGQGPGEGSWRGKEPWRPPRVCQGG